MRVSPACGSGRRAAACSASTGPASDSEGLRLPRKKQHESQAKQSARFRSEVQKLIDAGELNPTEADAAFERLLTRDRLKR